MQANNILFLKNNYPKFLKMLSEYEKSNDLIFQTSDTKSGLSTIQVTSNGVSQLVHSKYNPKREAESFIEQFADDIENYEHVLFYGLGLGYHIEEFMKKYPKYYFSIYEPSLEIFNCYLEEKDINSLPIHRLRNMFIESSREEKENFLADLTNNIQERILLIVLPSYQYLFKEQFQQFSDSFKAAVGAKKQTYYIDTLFSARWTLNSLLNLPKTILTPNIMSEEFKRHFKDKPLIIVSAGPSLEEEYENLRYIKKNKLAYIFAVGSANRALISKKIIPDAVCTYDPQQHNYGVFMKMMDEGIDHTVPMIFGSSVGFETLTRYQGPKLHMITSQDTVSQYYLGTQDVKYNIVQDAPTIAAVTYQLASELGCNPIILAGQNLGFLNNQFYSKEVDYNSPIRKTEVMEMDRKNIRTVKDVYGNEIETNNSFENMRQALQVLISKNSEIETINTTKGGAHIEGATFKTLDKLISSELHEQVVEENWYMKSLPFYDYKNVQPMLTKMQKSISEFYLIYKEIDRCFSKMVKCIGGRQQKKLINVVNQFDSYMKKLASNELYNIYVLPINRTVHQALAIKAANIRKQTNQLERARLIIDSFKPYIDRCYQTVKQLAASVFKVHEEVEFIISNRDKDLKFYSCDSGVFKYSGKWKKNNFGPHDNVEFYQFQYRSKAGSSSVCFKIKSQFLKVYGLKSRNGSQNIEIVIDGKMYKLSTKDFKIDNQEFLSNRECLIDINNLNDQIHEVQILLKDDKEFIFSGIEINKNGRAFHMDEVTNINELAIGKRIRAHYEASFNKVGKFSGFGYETNEFISSKSSTVPCGDFYFVMVDEGKCIADRHIQKGISWRRLDESNITNKSGIILNEATGNLSISLLNGGKSSEDAENDWDKYIQSKKSLDFCFYWNISQNELVWCSDYIEDDGDIKAVVRGNLQMKGETTINIREWEQISQNNFINCYFRPLLKYHLQ